MANSKMDSIMDIKDKSTKMAAISNKNIKMANSLNLGIDLFEKI